MSEKKNSTKTSRKRGRPVTFDTSVATEICLELAEGRTLREICRRRGIPESTVRGWVADDREGFAAQYARARDFGLDTMVDELIEITDDGTNDFRSDKDGNVRFDHEHVQRSRLRVDARKWYLAKLAPKRYGDRQTIEHDGVTTINVVTGISAPPGSRRK